MKKVNDVQKKKLDLKKRTIAKLNDDIMIKLAGGETTEIPDNTDGNSTSPKCGVKSKVVDTNTKCPEQ